MARPDHRARQLRQPRDGVPRASGARSGASSGCRVSPRARPAWAWARDCRRCRPPRPGPRRRAAFARQLRPCWRSVRPCADAARRAVPPPPGAADARHAARHRGARAAGRAAGPPSDHRVAGVARRDGRPARHPCGADRRRAERLDAAARAPGDPAAARRRLGAGERPSRSASRPTCRTRTSPVLLEALALLEPAERPLLVLAGHGTDTGRAAGPRAPARRGGRRAAARRGRRGRLEDLYAAAAVSSPPRCWRASGCRCSRRSGAACPWRAPICRCCARWRATPRSGSTRTTRRSVAAALRRALMDGPDVERLRDLGRDRAQRFTWRAAAEQTARVYEQAAVTRPG